MLLPGILSFEGSLVCAGDNHHLLPNNPLLPFSGTSRFRAGALFANHMAGKKIAMTMCGWENFTSILISKEGE